MTTESTPDPTVPTEININDLAHYVVLGMTKEGQPVTMRSENLTLQDMVGLLSRAKLSVDIEKIRVALEAYRREREAQSSIIKASGRLS